MPRTGPGGQEEQDPRALGARDGAPLVGLERQERAGPSLELLAGRLDAHAAVDDEDERVLLDLVVAKLLPRIEPDQHGARGLVGVEHDR